MSQEAIETLLMERIGLDPSSIGSKTITGSINQRMAVCNITDTTRYFKYVMNSKHEMEELFELVVIPETWFFRDKEPFAYLRNYIAAERLPSHKDRQLRVLSAPCSTGEEPYSISISLIEAGLNTERFRIDAVDISRKALEKAKRGIYGKNSFRYEDIDFQKKYLIQTGNEFIVIPKVKESVNFIHHNLINDLSLNSKELYDIIFCRNLLIYFDLSRKKELIKTLDSFLTKEGLLFVGYAETLQILTSGYKLIPHPRAFAYKKIERENRKRQLPLKISPVHTGNSDLTRNKSYHLAANKPPELIKNRLSPLRIEQTAKNESFERREESFLDSAQKLADHGHLDKAVLLCEKTLHETGPDAHVYFLLGLIRESMGDTEGAEQNFNKSVYLEPNNYEALIHLALLSEYRNEIEKARILRQRAQRIYAAEEKGAEN